MLCFRRGACAAAPSLHDRGRRGSPPRARALRLYAGMRYSAANVLYGEGVAAVEWFDRLLPAAGDLVQAIAIA